MRTISWSLKHLPGVVRFRSYAVVMPYRFASGFFQRCVHGFGEKKTLEVGFSVVGVWFKCPGIVVDSSSYMRTYVVSSRGAVKGALDMSPTHGVSVGVTCVGGYEWTRAMIKRLLSSQNSLHEIL